MRRNVIALLAAAALAATGFTTPSEVAAGLATDVATEVVGQPAALSRLAPGDGEVPEDVITSDNVTYHATLLTDSPGVSARLWRSPDVTEDGTPVEQRLYVSSVQGLRVYEVSDPSLPILISAIELPNWENENIAVSKDGRTALITEFTANAWLHVITFADGPLATDVNGRHVQTLVPSVAKLGILNGANHTTACIGDECNYLYGSSGRIIDLHDRTNPVILPETWTAKTGLPGGHNIEVDDNGLVWTDTTPIGVMDVTDPLNPELVVNGDPKQHGKNGTQYQHNNLRVRETEYEPRTPEEYRKELRSPEDPGYDPAIDTVRPGELFYGNGETNFSPRCGGGSGPFTTWRVRTLDPAHEDAHDAFEVLDVFRPVNGAYTGNGDPAVDAMGCSGHWFTVNPSTPSLVAAAWYEHGTRLLSVDEGTGEISQIGFFQPVNGSASQAYWINDEWVYTIDYQRGIDILHYDGDAPVPTQERFDRSWLAKLGVVDPISQQERYYCSLATRQS